MRSIMNRQRWIVIFCLVIGCFLCCPLNGYAQNNTLKVVLETNKGNITLSLYQTQAPITVANFLRYVDEGFYNGTIFHRVIAGFMIQGGGVDTSMNFKQTHAPIKNEADNGIPNTQYTIAMARTNNPDSATSQFFINLADNPHLNYSADRAGYAVFGQVIGGTEVVDAIGALETTSVGLHENIPVITVIINKAVRLTDSETETETEIKDSDSSSCFIKTAIKQ